MDDTTCGWFCIIISVVGIIICNVFGTVLDSSEIRGLSIISVVLLVISFICYRKEL